MKTVARILLCAIISIAMMDNWKIGCGMLQEPHYQSTSTCSGTGFANLFDLPCQPDQVIAIDQITVGAKKVSTGCPTYWEPWPNLTACCVESVEDCDFLFDTSINPVYHERCNGINTCNQISVTPSTTKDKCTDEYNEQTNYMYIDYLCITKSRIMEMNLVASITVEDEAVYLWNVGFPDNMLSNDGEETMCSVEVDNCDARIQIFNLQIEFATSSNKCEQTLEVRDRSNSTLIRWGCSDTTVEIASITGPSYLIVHMINNRSEDGGRFWLAFQSTMSANISIECPPKGPTYCNSTTTSTTTRTTITTTTTAPTTTTTTTTTPITTTTTTTAPNTTTTTTITPITTTTTTTAPTTTTTTTTTPITTTAPTTITTPTTTTTTTTSMTTNTTEIPTATIIQHDWILIVIAIFGTFSVLFILAIIVWLLYKRHMRSSRRKHFQKLDSEHSAISTNGNKHKNISTTAETTSELYLKHATANRKPVHNPNNQNCLRPKSPAKIKSRTNAGTKKQVNAIMLRKQKRSSSASTHRSNSKQITATFNSRYEQAPKTNHPNEAKNIKANTAKRNKFRERKRLTRSMSIEPASKLSNISLQMKSEESFVDNGSCLNDVYKSKRNKRNDVKVINPVTLKHRRYNKVEPKQKRTKYHKSDHPVLRHGQSFRSMYNKLKLTLGLIYSYDESDPFGRKRTEGKLRSAKARARSARIAARLNKK